MDDYKDLYRFATLTGKDGKVSRILVKFKAKDEEMIDIYRQLSVKSTLDIAYYVHFNIIDTYFGIITINTKNESINTVNSYTGDIFRFTSTPTDEELVKLIDFSYVSMGSISKDIKIGLFNVAKEDIKSKNNMTPYCLVPIRTKEMWNEYRY